MGFYNSKDKPLPHGVEVWSRNCTARDEQGEWEELQIPTLAVCLPKMERLNQIERLSPLYWEESQTFYWGFKQRGNVAFWCILDLLDRLVLLRNWNDITTIPIRWRLGNAEAKALVEKHTQKMNQGERFVLKAPINIPSNVTLNEARHFYTPYDYEWQTSKRDRDEAKEYWNSIIRS